MVNYDPAEYFRMTDDVLGPCPICNAPGDCDCLRDDEEWWENTESEVAAIDREEQR